MEYVHVAHVGFGGGGASSISSSSSFSLFFELEGIGVRQGLHFFQGHGVRDGAGGEDEAVRIHVDELPVVDRGEKVGGGGGWVGGWEERATYLSNSARRDSGTSSAPASTALPFLGPQFFSFLPPPPPASPALEKARVGGCCEEGEEEEEEEELLLWRVILLSDCCGVGGWVERMSDWVGGGQRYRLRGTRTCVPAAAAATMGRVGLEET